MVPPFANGNDLLANQREYFNFVKWSKFDGNLKKLVFKANLWSNGYRLEESSYDHRVSNLLNTKSRTFVNKIME